ncbi:uncharacterized protein LOC141599221 isoform X3 [Silene latifolia]|uniref:uncharacterized protein LOC141599221 isoform X3 n=1 Tax=Silene latifolia TaxID=37657 RepID=UPI003D76BE65
MTVMKEFGSFSSGLDYFSQAHVIASRDYQEPMGWWANHGAAAPLLQSLAFRLLSQPASSSSCERNWSDYGNIKTLKRNRLTSDRAKMLVKVHTNIRLLARQEENYKKGSSKYWDLGGDKYDVEELADISVDDPVLEGLGDGDNSDTDAQFVG